MEGDPTSDYYKNCGICSSISSYFTYKSDLSPTTDTKLSVDAVKSKNGIERQPASEIC